MFEGGVETADEAQTAPLSWSGYAPDGIMTMLLAQAGTTSDRFELLERIGGGEKIIAWAQARQYEEIARFVATAETTPAVGLNPVQAVESAQAEVALMLRLSPGGAAWQVGEARQLVEEFPATFAALHAGAITLTKARIITEGCADLDAAAAAVVERKVLARAPEQSNGQLRAAARRAVLRVVGEAAVRRRERKRRERGVALYPERDGMATLSVTLPAAEAVGTFAVLDQHARGCGSADERSMAARRADALVDLVLRETGFCSSAGQQTTEKSTATAGPTSSQAGQDSGDSSTATTPVAATAGADPADPIPDVTGSADSERSGPGTDRTATSTPTDTVHPPDAFIGFVSTPQAAAEDWRSAAHRGPAPADSGGHRSWQPCALRHRTSSLARPRPADRRAQAIPRAYWTRAVISITANRSRAWTGKVDYAF
jgi:hypothetical protein